MASWRLGESESSLPRAKTSLDPQALARSSQTILVRIKTQKQKSRRVNRDAVSLCQGSRLLIASRGSEVGFHLPLRKTG